MATRRESARVLSRDRVEGDGDGDGDDVVRLPRRGAKQSQRTRDVRTSYAGRAGERENESKQTT